MAELRRKRAWLLDRLESVESEIAELAPYEDASEADLEADGTPADEGA